ncbi:MAG: hypothetical protein WC869_01245 [Phycisphaerae bacterium]|jgi:hypothetical protein
MQIDFDKLTRVQKIVAIRAFIAAGSPDGKGLDFEIKVNGVPMDFLKFVDAFVASYDDNIRCEAVALIGQDVRLSKLHEALHQAEQSIINTLATTLGFDHEQVESIMRA